MRKKNPDARAMLLAALEFGVSPMVQNGYSKTRPEEHRELPDRPDRYALRRRIRKPVAPLRTQRKTKGLIVTAEDILAGRSVVR